MEETIIWTALTCIARVYSGYPLLILAGRSRGRRPVRTKYYEPSVNLAIPTHNGRHA